MQNLWPLVRLLATCFLVRLLATCYSWINPEPNIHVQLLLIFHLTRFSGCVRNLPGLGIGIKRHSRKQFVRKNSRERFDIRNKRTAWLSVFLLAGAGIVAVATMASPASRDDEKAVMAAATQFYDALNTMFTGDLDPMKNTASSK